MPWQASEAGRHAAGLTKHQAQVWARVANAALRSCTANGRSQAECEGAAIRQANAVAKRAPAKSIKLADDGSLQILAIPFDGPFDRGDGKGVDTDGEFFSERTNLCLDWYGVQRPLLYEHGRDDDLQVTPIGKVDSASVEKDEAGWWVRAQLDKSNRYWSEIARLIEDERLYASSGTMSHLVKRANDGEIIQWPWCELSLTPNPANLFATVTPAEAVKHYKAAGMTPPPTLDPDDARPYVDLLDRLTDDSVEFIDLTRRLAEGRTKVGRALSRKRREQLLALAGQWESGAADLRQIVAEAETAPKPEARADGEAADQEQEQETPESAPAEAGAADAGKTAEATEQGGLTAHVDPDLAAAFAEFQRADAFYGAALTPGRLRGARIVRT